MVSQSQGKVTLTAATNLSVATAGAGLVQGGIISLTATGGGIGNSTTTPLILNTPNPVPGLVDTVTASAQTNVYLQEKTGNMLVNSISTGGNVWLNVPNGSVINANTNSTTDTRTEAQLAAGVWTDLGLTAGTGYQTKVNDTLSSFAGAQDAQFQAYWEDINSGNTTGTGFLQLAAIYGPGGTYATQDPSYNPNVYNGSAFSRSRAGLLLRQHSEVPIYFTAAGTAQTAQVYFTAGANGTIARTDGLSWLTEGFAAGQIISISGSGLDFDRFDLVHHPVGNRERHYARGRSGDPERGFREGARNDHGADRRHDHPGRSGDLGGQWLRCRQRHLGHRVGAEQHPARPDLDHHRDQRRGGRAVAHQPDQDRRVGRVA